MSPELLRLTFFGLIFLAVIFEAIADIYFKKWALGGTKSMIGIGLILYAIGTLIWAYSLKYEYLSKAISIFTVVNLIVIV